MLKVTTIKEKFHAYNFMFFIYFVYLFIYFFSLNSYVYDIWSLHDPLSIFAFGELQSA